jgi:hypothetical protein
VHDGRAFLQDEGDEPDGDTAWNAGFCIPLDQGLNRSRDRRLNHGRDRLRPGRPELCQASRRATDAGCGDPARSTRDLSLGWRFPA